MKVTASVVALAMGSVETAPGAVQKVVAMLQDMKHEVEAEGEKDQELYEKMQCWCSTNGADKKKSIKDAQASIIDLTAAIEEDTAMVAKLETELEQTEHDRTANENMLQQATEMREKQNAEYEATHKDTMQAIQQLTDAIATLEKNFGADGSTLLQVRAVAKQIAHQYDAVLDKDYASVVDSLNLDSDTEEVAREAQFLPPALQLNQAPAGYKSYNAASGKILGILKQMKEGMETDDSGATEVEASQRKAFLELKEAKENEIAAQTRQIDDKTGTLADTKVHKDNAKEDLEQTEKTLEADQSFLADLEEQCSTADKEHSERVQERSEELTAIAETLGILTSDEARALFSSSIGGFAQVDQSSSQVALRGKAATVLRRAYSKTASAALLNLAVAVKLDAFTEVVKAMDDLIAELKKEQEEEFHHRDHCVAATNENEDDTLANQRVKGDLENTIEQLEVQIEQLKDETAALNEQIDQTQTAVKRAGEDRGAANRQYQATVADQRATVKILQFALGKLESFYKKESFVSASVHRAPGEAPEPAPEQGVREKSANAGGVMTMIQMIIEDALRLEKESIHDEVDSQAEYEKLLRDSFQAISDAQRSIVEKTATKADADSQLAQAKGDLKHTDEQLELLAKTSLELHAECDYLIKNFQVRQQSREEEIESIGRAKAILLGAK
jgi:chromosome segregation ATPase